MRGILRAAPLPRLRKVKPRWQPVA